MQALIVSGDWVQIWRSIQAIEKALSIATFLPILRDFPGLLPAAVVLRIIFDPMVPKHLQHPSGAKNATEERPGLNRSIWVPQVQPSQLDPELLVLRSEPWALGEAWRWCELPLPSSHVVSYVCA